MDYAQELAEQMVAQIEETVANEHGMKPDEPDSFRLMCNIELLCLIGQHAGLSFPESAIAEGWKARYLAAWEASIDGLDPKPGFRDGRRAVIMATFDRLINLCRGP
jgi:hypothetical protein